jgi:hypothetical protein
LGDILFDAARRHRHRNFLWPAGSEIEAVTRRGKQFATLAEPTDDLDPGSAQNDALAALYDKYLSRPAGEDREPLLLSAVEQLILAAVVNPQLDDQLLQAWRVNPSLSGFSYPKAAPTRSRQEQERRADYRRVLEFYRMMPPDWRIITRLIQELERLKPKRGRGTPKAVTPDDLMLAKLDIPRIRDVLAAMNKRDVFRLLPQDDDLNGMPQADLGIWRAKTKELRAEAEKLPNLLATPERVVRFAAARWLIGFGQEGKRRRSALRGDEVLSNYIKRGRKKPRTSKATQE